MDADSVGDNSDMIESGACSVSSTGKFILFIQKLMNIYVSFNMHFSSLI